MLRSRGAAAAAGWICTAAGGRPPSRPGTVSSDVELSTIGRCFERWACSVGRRPGRLGSAGSRWSSWSGERYGAPRGQNPPKTSRIRVFGRKSSKKSSEPAVTPPAGALRHAVPLPRAPASRRPACRRHRPGTPPCRSRQPLRAQPAPISRKPSRPPPASCRGTSPANHRAGKGVAPTTGPHHRRRRDPVPGPPNTPRACLYQPEPRSPTTFGPCHPSQLPGAAERLGCAVPCGGAEHKVGGDL
jgi:hypothetical protein